MKQVNLRGRFYGTVMRSVVMLLVLILFLVLIPQAIILENQKFIINHTSATGVDVAKVLISFGIVGVLLYFAYSSETQLPKTTKDTKFRWMGLIVSSVVHIAVIFIAYSYLLQFAINRGQINQVFNAIFLVLLCVPVFRGGGALYKTINLFIAEAESKFGEADKLIKCSQCDMSNSPSAKFCENCGNKLSWTLEVQKSIVCDRCEYENDSSAKFCANCGNKFSNITNRLQAITCRQCGAENGANVKFCNKCATDLSS